ncbi:hypothetical protein CMI47_06730 [Candidatus Pacearchaeota archaeon]|nr:hypothetical protein [Candidatus Pacearchaeota archaeon]|tara:strand:+ start:182 stop:466 length:285 start_codon:yes stop_codon:yes gene_type:complete
MPYDDDPDKKEFFLKRHIYHITTGGLGFTASRNKAIEDTERDYVPFWAKERKILPCEVMFDYLCPPASAHKIRRGVCVICGTVPSECVVRGGDD